MNREVLKWAIVNSRIKWEKRIPHMSMKTRKMYVNLIHEMFTECAFCLAVSGKYLGLFDRNNPLSHPSKRDKATCQSGKCGRNGRVCPVQKVCNWSVKLFKHKKDRMMKKDVIEISDKFLDRFSWLWNEYELGQVRSRYLP